MSVSSANENDIETAPTGRNQRSRGANGNVAYLQRHDQYFSWEPHMKNILMIKEVLSYVDGYDRWPMVSERIELAKGRKGNSKHARRSLAFTSPAPSTPINPTIESLLQSLQEEADSANQEIKTHQKQLMLL